MQILKKISRSLIFLLIFLILPEIVFAEDKLLQKSDFVYLGAFKVPKGELNSGHQYQGLGYGGSVIAYNPVNNSLFIVGHDWNQQVAEISIPQPVNTTDLGLMNTATVVQNLFEITEGNMRNLRSDGSPITENSVKIGGMLKYGDKLIGSVFAYYDAGHEAVRSHFKSNLDFSQMGDFAGMFEVGTKPAQVPQAGLVAGYMTQIPASWQIILGGKALTGMSALSILGRTSSGPAAFAFDPDALGTTAAPAVPLVYYPIDHQTIGTYSSSQTLYNKGSYYAGITFPTGSKSIIYTGRQGLGEACYGPGTNILAEAGNRYNYESPNNTCMGEVMTNTADPCCYDPVDLNKGAHAYPYVDYVWAYDAQDFLRVKNAGRVVDDPSPNLVDSVSATSTETYKPWFIKPYATWELDFPTEVDSGWHNGAAAYDEVNRKLYVVQMGRDSTDYPIIHVFNINLEDDLLAPTSPSNLVVM